MRTLLGSLIVLSLAACSPVAYPVDSPNPLNQPDTREPTVAELHTKNLRLITGNPAYP